MLCYKRTFAWYISRGRSRHVTRHLSIKMNLKIIIVFALLELALLIEDADARNCTNLGTSGHICQTEDDCCSVVCTFNESRGLKTCVGDICTARGSHGTICTDQTECCSTVCIFSLSRGVKTCLGD